MDEYELLQELAKIKASLGLLAKSTDDLRRELLELGKQEVANRQDLTHLEKDITAISSEVGRVSGMIQGALVDISRIEGNIEVYHSDGSKTEIHVGDKVDNRGEMSGVVIGDHNAPPPSPSGLPKMFVMFVIAVALLAAVFGTEFVLKLVNAWFGR